MPVRQETGRWGPSLWGERIVAGGVIRLGPLTFVPVVLREFGCDPNPIINSVGLSLSHFEDPDRPIPYLAVGRLLALCAKATGCAHFGMLLGARTSGSSLGITGFIIHSAPDVGTALGDLVKHLDLHDQGGVPTLSTGNDVTLLGYAIHQAGVDGSEQIYDLMIAIACKIMRELCGANWHPLEVLLARRRPENLTPYQRFFQAPLRFGTDQCALVFPTRWLDHRLPGADPLLHRHLEREASELHTRMAADPAGELCRVLRKLLPSQMCSLAEAAKQLGIHERTLNRRLRAEGTTFRHERGAVRYAAAQHFLADSAMTVAAIAMALSYADASAFSHAFKRWSGATPGQWRAGRRRSGIGLSGDDAQMPSIATTRSMP